MRLASCEQWIAAKSLQFSGWAVPAENWGQMQQAQGAQPTASTANTLLLSPEPYEARWNQQKITISPGEDQAL